MEGGGGEGRIVLTRLNTICLKNSSLHYFKLFFAFTLNLAFSKFSTFCYVKFFTFVKIFYLFEKSFRIFSSPKTTYNKQTQ